MQFIEQFPVFCVPLLKLLWNISLDENFRVAQYKIFITIARLRGEGETVERISIELDSGIKLSAIEGAADNP
tara:strand:+ start:1440 stop:1655 length:216 start_codon:yes stop_codon:yes gene_type:complete